MNIIEGFDSGCICLPKYIYLALFLCRYCIVYTFIILSPSSMYSSNRTIVDKKQNI